MKPKNYLKIIHIPCPVCGSQAESVGYFYKDRLIKTYGINCVCGNQQKADYKPYIPYEKQLCLPTN